jgi:hypothetical protein
MNESEVGPKEERAREKVEPQKNGAPEKVLQ